MGLYDQPTEDPFAREEKPFTEVLYERWDRQLTKAYTQNGQLMREIDDLRAERDRLQSKLDKVKELGRAIEALLDALDMPARFPEDEEDEVLDDAEGF